MKKLIYLIIGICLISLVSAETTFFEDYEDVTLYRGASTGSVTGGQPVYEKVAETVTQFGGVVWPSYPKGGVILAILFLIILIVVVRMRKKYKKNSGPNKTKSSNTG